MIEGSEMRRGRGVLAVLAAVVALSGCAGAMRQYDTELGDTMERARGGRMDEALKKLEENNSGADKDLLYFLEKGELLRMKGDIAASRDAWLKADETVRAWEEVAKTDPQRILSEAGAFLVNDKTRRYDGQDYEKVLLSTRLAMDHALLGDWNAARVEVKKMHEREAVIAEFRAKEVEDAKAKGQENNIKTTYKDLKGYPVELLDDPEVVKLRNGYQSAIGHYLAGFVYEALGEPSLAAAGYRQAIELRPGVPLLEQSLAELDQRVGRGGGKTTDVLFVLEAGEAPAWKSVTIPLPVPTGRGWVAAPTSFPVIRSMSKGIRLPALRIDGKAVSAYPVTDVEVQARRALKDQMPGIVVRTTIRAIAKGAIQAGVQRKDSSGLLSLATMVVAVVTEQADERSWRSLPALIGIARVALAPGRHTLDFPGGKREIEVGGRHQLVVIKDLGGFIALAQSPAAAVPVVAEAPATPAPEPEVPVAKTPVRAKGTPAKKPATADKPATRKEKTP